MSLVETLGTFGVTVPAEAANVASTEVAMVRLSYGLISFAVAAVFAAHVAFAGKGDAIIHPTGKAAELPQGEKIGDISFACKNRTSTCTLTEYMEYAHVCALLVVKGGKIRLERYRPYRDNETKCRPDKGVDRKDKEYGIASIIKSLTSTLLGQAIAWKYKAATLAEFDAVLRMPVEEFIPALGKGQPKSGYAGMPLDRVLRMRSGVKWKEYGRPPTDSDKFDETVKKKQETIVGFAQGYVKASGTKFNYSALDASINGAVAESLLENSEKLPDFLEKTLWKAIGAEAEARWKVDKAGTGIGACCFYLRIHDLARFGLFVLRNGRDASGHEVIPGAWFDLATRRQPDSADDIPFGNPSYNDKCKLGKMAYRYQWWLLPKRTDFTAIGIDGQFLHIYPDADALIVQISDWENWTDGNYLECETFAAHDALIEAIK